MGQFYITVKSARLLALMRANGYELRQGKKHIKATNPASGRFTMVPRHKDLANGTTESICNFLIQEGMRAENIARHLK